MLKKFVVLLAAYPLLLQAGIFGWFEGLSPKAERAKKTLEGIDPIIEKALSEYCVPGVAIGVVVDGSVVYAKGLGMRDIEKKLPMTSSTIFPIGSCTKSFTTFAFGTLVDEGKISWDQRVIDILPEFRLWDQYAMANLTFRDLLTHRSGMPRHEFTWYNAKISREELLRRIRYLQPSSDIRERYQYGNLMYFVAGLAMEKVAQTTWEDCIRKRILTPLGMAHTYFSLAEALKTGNMASPYIEKSEGLKKLPYRDLSLIGAAGAINSNVDDMSRWMQMQLADGAYNNHQLISPVTLQELYAPQVIVPGTPETKETPFSAYGIGWVVVSYRDHYFVSHDGVSDGFTSMIGLFPKENVGIVILSNKNMCSFSRFLSFAIVDRIFNHTGHDWLQEGLEVVRKSQEGLKKQAASDNEHRKKNTIPSHPLEEYVGLYEHPGYGPLDIALVNGKLELAYNGIEMVLDHWHYDVFSVAKQKQETVVPLEGWKVTFGHHSNGDIGEVSIPFEPTGEDIVFKKQAEAKLSSLNYLRQFTGIYEIYGHTVEVLIRDHTLVAIIPGQPNYELVPAGENEFLVKAATGSSVRFVMDEKNKVKEILLTHPYGAFSALPKNRKI